MNHRLPNQALFSRLNPLIFKLLYLKHRGRTHAIVNAPGGTVFKTRVDSSDMLLVWEIWRFGVYRDRHVAIHPGDTVLDIGAHIGVFAVWAARQAGAAGRVLAYEASRGNYELLFENKALNAADNLHPHHLAVHDRPGEVVLYQPDGNGALGSLMQDTGSRAETVTATTLEEILDRHGLDRIDYLKLDAEGAEYPILLNAPRSALDRVQKLVLEFHEFVGSPHNRGVLAEHLRASGFRVSVETGLPGQTLLFGTGVIKAWR